MRPHNLAACAWIGKHRFTAEEVRRSRIMVSNNQSSKKYGWFELLLQFSTTRLITINCRRQLHFLLRYIGS